ncbi:MAG: zinc metalloprotease HtpX [Deltaproteobacteria bacterium]|nr:zinc metalloprotease HtpX [Deltaproteobacteria bacterium]
MNRVKTTLLLGLLTGLLLVIGQWLGGQQGLTIALIMAAGMNFFAYWFSDKMVLAMYRAREVSAEEAPELHGIVANLCQRARIPRPRVYLIPSETPNAFATGRNPEHAAVAVTEGILGILNERELAGVLGHELSHVRHRDILVSSIAATIAGAIMYLAHMAQWAAFFGGGRASEDEEGGGGGGILGLLVMAIVAPLAATLIQMAISRAREYLADEGGARLTTDPEALASALETLAYASKPVPLEGANPASAHLFIVNPLTGGSFLSLFSTHPPMGERVRRLRAMRLAY